MDLEEAVILVVGGEAKYKARVADALAEGCAATAIETTKGGVRIFRRKSSPEAVVVETTPAVVYEGQDAASNSASMWVSLDSLRRFSGKLVFVVCVVTSSGPNDPVHNEPDFSEEKLSWLQMLGFIFHDNKKDLMVLVKVDGYEASGRVVEPVRTRIREVLERDGFMRNNVSFQAMEKDDLRATLTKALQCSVQKRTGNPTRKVDGMAPFFFKKVTLKSKDVHKYGPWGPERVVLFGRTGSGKSTLCQMLTSGRLDPLSESTTSSSIRGETKEIKAVEGRGWYVLDTPGFGGLKDAMSTVSTEQAEKILKRYISRIDGVYSHFVYVVMKDRIDMLEAKPWGFFLLLFAADSQSHFTVVVSNATEKWVLENLSTLKLSFRGCDSFLSGEFPSTQIDDEEWEAELEEVRTESLKTLEEELAVLSRKPITCYFGKAAKGSLREWSGRFKYLLRASDEPAAMKAIVSGAVVGTQGVVSISALLGRLSTDDKIVLLPL